MSGVGGNNGAGINDINTARAAFYNFFGRVFLEHILKDSAKVLEQQLGVFLAHPLDDSLLAHFQLLFDEIAQNGVDNLLDEYTRLFMLPFAVPESDAPTSKSSAANAESSSLRAVSEANGVAINNVEQSTTCHCEPHAVGRGNPHTADADSPSLRDLSQMRKVEPLLNPLVNSVQDLPASTANNNEDSTEQESPIQSARKKRENRPNPQVFLYLSHYVEGFLNGQSLLKAKTLMRRSKKRLDTAACSESEDHFGVLCIFMETLLRDGENALAAECFNALLKPMLPGLIKAIFSRQDSHFYTPIAHIASTFFELESMGNK